MARYRVKETSFINDQIVHPGDEIDYDQDPGENLEPIDDDAKSKAADYAQRMSAQAAMVAAGVGATTNEQTIAEIQNLMATMTTLGQRVAALEAAPNSANAGVAAVGARVDGLAADVAEHDAGLQIIDGRLQDVETTLNVLKAASTKTAAPAPASADAAAPTA